MRIIKDILKGKFNLYNLKHRKIFYELMTNNKKFTNKHKNSN